MKKVYKKNQKGITLIGLVVTIIVLLILAGVSLRLVTGNNGILKRAENAVTSSNDANDKEEIELAIAELSIAYYDNFETNQNETVKNFILKKCENETIPTDTGGNLKTNNGKLIYTNSKGETKYVELLDNGSIAKIDSLTNSTESLNVIYMIGDGMGKNHIKAAEINKGSPIYMQTIPNQTDVTTYSLSVSQYGEYATDSAAAATALATGVKTINYYVGKDENQNNVQNLTEYAHSIGMKTGTISTQTICHATPAGFTTHASNRNNYSTIAERQVTEQEVDLMLGGGQQYYDSLTEQMLAHEYNYITDFSELSKYNKNQKVIGAFSWGRMTQDSSNGSPINAEPSLVQMTQAAFSRLENENGFLVMIEGSDIDTYSHIYDRSMTNMLNELYAFDNAIKVAMDYVDTHPNTILIVTADHETGGLNLENVTTKEQLTDDLFTNYNHTNENVMVYAYGRDTEQLTNCGTIDNTDIHNFIKQKLQASNES